MSYQLKPLRLLSLTSLALLSLFYNTNVFAQATYTWSGPNNGSWTSSGNWTPTRSSTANSDILQFTDGTTKTIIAVPTQTIGRLVVSGNTSVTLNPSGTNRTLTVGNGAGTDLTIASGSTLTIGTSSSGFAIALANSASADISGTLVVSANQAYTTTAASSSTAVSTTGMIRNSGTVNSATGQLSFASGADYVHTRNGGTIPASTWNANSNAEITGITNNVPGGLNQSFGNFIWNCAGQIADINFLDNFSTVNGNFTVSNTGGDHLFMGSNDNVVINIGGNITVGSPGNTAILDMDDDGGSITFNFDGDLITLGNGQIDNTGDNNATFNFDRATGTQNINLGNANSFVLNWGGNLNFGSGSGTNEVVLQTNLALASTYTTNITVLSGTTFNMGSFIISNRGTFTADAGSILSTSHTAGLSVSSSALGNVQVSGAKSYSTGADYKFNGAAAQVTGAGLPATVRRLIIDNASGVNTSGGVTLSQSASISTQLQLNNGYLKTTTTSLPTLAAGSTVSFPVGSNTFVSGPMRKTGNTTFEFPTGYAGLTGGRVPIRISGMSASATMQAEYKRAPSSGVGSIVSSPLHHVSNCEYWELFPTTGSVNATITMYWNAFSNCAINAYVNNIAALRVARSNGTTWSNVGGVGGSLVTGTINSNANTSTASGTRYFSLASTTGGINPLPVLFANERAYAKNNGVQIEWSNMTEKDVLQYTVQRSADGRDFTDVGMLAAKSNQSDRADYSIFDAQPIQGINYYRIAAAEMSGRLVYSKVLQVDINGSASGLSLYPNPVVNNQFTVSLKKINAGNYHIRILNVTGQQVYYKNLVVRGSAIAESIALPAGMPKGVYNMLINSQDYSEKQVFILR